MTVDPLSPIAPARLRALLLPVGKVRRSRFLSFVARLQAHNVVRLGDVSPEGRLNRHNFSPLAYPSGMIVYDLSISVPPTTHLDVFPFELFREPLLILAIADGAELPASGNVVDESSSEEKPNRIETAKHPSPEGLDLLTQELSELKAYYPRSLVQQLLVFDYNGLDNIVSGPEGAIWVPSHETSRPTTMKTVMCDISSLVLEQLQKFSEAIQHFDNIDSPKVSSWGPRRTIESRPTEKPMHRMTMPAQLPSRPNDHSTDSSDSVNTGGHEFPTTFDEITRSIHIDNKTTSAIKSGSKPGSKEHSRDRSSLQNLGNLSASERAKSRLQGRMNVVAGSLYLQAGIWPEAVKEFVEGATIARAGSDYIWHAKALESIMVCLIMLGWVGANFQIPQICFPNGDKTASKLQSSMSGVDINIHGQSNPEARAVALQSLTSLLPDITSYILSLYARASNITDEPLPQLVYSETVIRFAKLLATIHVRDGSLDTHGIQYIVMNLPLEWTTPSGRPRSSPTFRKTELASFLYRALPASLATEVPVTDVVQILVGMAAVLSLLGLERKRAFILKELFSILIPGLVQARKIGAAEMGIHPAAGLSALNDASFDINALDVGTGNMESSMKSILTLMGEVYGAKGSMNRNSGSGDSQSHEQILECDSAAAIAERTFRHCTVGAYGDLALKIEILKSCINFCEALPDFPGVLQFTVGLLQVIRGTYMLPPRGKHRKPILGQDEQVRLYNNVKRTVNVAHKLGVSDLEADYWDDFLVRGVEVQVPSDIDRPIQRSNKDFGGPVIPESQRDNGPFIYSAFSKTTGGTAESLMVSGEPTMVKILLQNPFDFGIEIEHLRLEGEGVEFDASANDLVIAPFSLEETLVPLLPTSEGALNITGCIVKVKYCRERRFPIFKKWWKPEIESKLKRTGLAAKEPLLDRPTSLGSNASESAVPIGKPPEADSVQVKVIKAQPRVVVHSTSLLQSAIMVLSGETTSFDITLQNKSDCPADLVLFTFEDSITNQIQTALRNKDSPPTDVYELEFQMSKYPPLRLRHDKGGNAKLSLGPGELGTFTIEVFGKPGLHDATVQVNYGYVGGVSSELPETFYARQATFPLTITVNSSVNISRCDILPLGGDFAWHGQQTEGENALQPTDNNSSSFSGSSLKSKSQPPARDPQISSMLSCLGSQNMGSEYCLVLLDLRNAWPNPLSASITFNDPAENALPSLQEVSDELQPGHVTRFALVIPRIFLEDPRQKIPVLNPSNRRQFVVSANKVAYESELSSRELFWFRQGLLENLRGFWKDEVTGSEGDIDLRGITLNSRMTDVLRVDDVDMNFNVLPLDVNSNGTKEDNASPETVVQTGRSKFTVATNTFLTLRTTIFNRSSKPIHPLIRIQPSLRNQPHGIALELSRRLSWTGMRQRALPILGPREQTEVNLGLTVHCCGEYEVWATVEEARVLKPNQVPFADGSDSIAPPAMPDNSSDEHHDDYQQSFGTNILNQRRIWHSRLPCIISARD